MNDSSAASLKTGLGPMLPAWLAERFEWVETLHTSGASIVERVRDRRDQTQVVLKRPGLQHAVGEQRLRHEHDILVQLKLAAPIAVAARALPCLLDFIEFVGSAMEPGGCALVLADFGAESLSQFLQRGTPPLAQALSIGARIAEILHDVHLCDVIHKDLNPNNILVRQAAEDMPPQVAVQIIDFNLATRMPRELEPAISPDSAAATAYNIGSASTGELNDGRLEGTLAYLSPEQSGRMNRSVDYRTDLYALGITLYRLLAGRLPFPSRDPLELLHCHIARQPPPLSQVAPHVPVIVERIVEKLLAKAPEERYQSSLGVQRDLAECLVRLEQSRDHATIADFAIATHDIRERFQLTQRLHGREREIVTLSTCVQRVADSASPELVLVSGAAGIGKSAVISELQRILVEQHARSTRPLASASNDGTQADRTAPLPAPRSLGFFARGKFDQLARDRPYSALLAALSHALHQIASSSESVLQRWRLRLLQVLASAPAEGSAAVDSAALASVLCPLLPELEIILGKQPPSPELPAAELRNRFRAAFQRLLKALSRQGIPLILFLDDVQWADAATLELLPLVLADRRGGSLIVIAAYRDNEVGPAHPLHALLAELARIACPVNRISLGPLSEDSLNDFVADTLHLPTDQTRDLSERLWQKTHGNALFAGAYLSKLYRDGLLRFDRSAQRWTWQMAEIGIAPIADNVVDVLVQRLSQLPAATRALLQRAAVHGHDVRPKDLQAAQAEARGDSPIAALPTGERLEQALREAVSEGFLLPRAGAYRFAHDRIQQAAYSTLNDQERRLLHAQIGRALLARSLPSAAQGARSEETRALGRSDTVAEAPSNLDDRTLFALSSHLNEAHALLDDREKMILCQLNLRTAQRARAAAAFVTAHENFRLGVERLPVDAWNRHPALAMELFIGQAECAYLSGHFEEAKQLLALLVEKAPTRSEKARVYYVAGLFHRHVGDTTLSTYALLDGLSELGIALPRSPSAVTILFEIVRTRRAMRRAARLAAAHKRKNGLAQADSLLGLLELPALIDPEAIGVLRMLSDATASAYFVSPNLLAVLLCRMIQLSLRRGHHALSAVAYVFLAAIVGSGLGNFAEGEELGQLALRLVERYPDAFTESQVKCVYVAIANHFAHPLRSGEPLLHAAWRRGEESGNLTYSVYAVNTLARWNLLSGSPLGELIADCERYLAAAALMNHAAGFEALRLIRQVARALRGETLGPLQLSSADFDQDKCLRTLTEMQMRVQVYFHHNYRALLCLIFSEPMLGLQHCDANRPDADAVLLGLLDVVEFYHLEALLIAQAMPQLTGLRRLRLRRRLQHNAKALARWAQHAPQNFRHRFLMVRAEQSWLAGRSDDSLRDLSQAVQAARQGSYLRDEAIGLERMATLLRLRQLHDAADLYLLQARRAYERYGALAKVAAIDLAHPDLVRSEASTATWSGISVAVPDRVAAGSGAGSPIDVQLSVSTTSAQAAAAFDVPTLLRAVQALSSEVAIDKLLLRIMNLIAENAGAENAALILDVSSRDATAPDGRGGAEQSTPLPSSEDTLRTFALLDGQVGLRMLDPQPAIDATPRLVPSIVHYVRRTQQRVLLPDATLGGEGGSDFSQDPVVVQRRPRSVLCLPLLHQGALMGVLYLENTLVAGAFTAARAELLTALCAQVAISIDNALLYSQLERRVAERTRALHEAQARLLRLERQSTEAQMAGGFAHEVRNAMTGARMLLSRVVAIEGQKHGAARGASAAGDDETWSLCIDNSRALKELFLAVRDALSAEQRARVVESIRTLNQNEQQLHQTLLHIDQALGRTLGLTRLLLEYAQLGKQSAKLIPGQAVALRQVVQAIAVELRDLLATESIALEWESIPAACQIACLPEHVDSILRNLILNAVDALRERRQRDNERACVIRCAAQMLTQPDGRLFWQIAIADSAAGIPQAIQPRIFEPFFSTKPSSGTGLGLNTVRKITWLYGGDIRFESEPGRGTTFFFHLPATVVSADALASSGRPDAQDG